MNLNNFRIKTKLLLLIGLMSVMTGIVAVFGVTRIGDLNTSIRTVNAVDDAGTDGALMNQSVIMLDRSEYRIAADPSQDTLQQIMQSTRTYRDAFEARYQAALKTANADEKAKLTRIRTAFDAYYGRMDQTLALAGQLGSGVELSDAQRRIYQQVTHDRALADELQSAVQDYVDHVEARGSHVTDTAVSSARTASDLMLVVAVGGVLSGIIIGWLMASFGISNPIRRSVEDLRRLAGGDLSVDVAGTERRDECGDIAKGLLVFRDNALKARELEAAAAEQEARVAAERRQAMLELADNFERSVGVIVTTVSSAATELQAAASQLSATAHEASAQSLAVSSAAEEAGASVTSVASSAEELGASVSEIGRQVESSAEISGMAVQEADRAAQVVGELSDVAASIGGVVELISGLAAQTNLLALNATIESARAGEAGKGFAVVASEVKALAGQTARATTEISAKIALIQQTTGRAVEAIQGITDTITDINSTSTAIASAVDQQSAATQEIVHAVTQASIGASEVTANISGVAEAAEQTGAAASQVLSSSGELAEQAVRLSHEMDRFLSNVRAA